MFAVPSQGRSTPVPDFLGHLHVQGQLINRAGFLLPGQLAPGYGAAPATGIQRGELGMTPDALAEFKNSIEEIKRGDLTGDANSIAMQLGSSLESLLSGLQRGITSTTSNLPIRENLEAEAKLLIPADTPFRNKVPRVPGAGTAAAWRQLTSLGGGWGTSYDQPGGGSAVRTFFAETGAPAEHTSVYAAKSAAYKLLGTYGSITGFAMAAGK